MSEREITVRKQASGSNLRDGARPTFLDKKNTIEMFNVTYAELSMMRDQMKGYQKLCNVVREWREVNKMIRKLEARMNEMVKINAA